MPIISLSLTTPPTHPCAICQRPAPTNWSGGEELDEVVVSCYPTHQDQARQRWDEVFARFQATLNLDEEG
jgi:hypothetical protein